MITPTPSLQEKKQVLRDVMRDKRHAHAQTNAFLFNMLADVFLQNIQLETDAVIASYHAFRDEVDTTPLIDKLRKMGHKIALPVILGKRTPLAFRLFEPGIELISNAMGIPEPALSAQEVEPDVLLIPLLAFDRKRNRLGYGGGYYDRTIAGLRARKKLLAIGVAYAYQEVADIPVGQNDMPLDKIVTEMNVF